MFLQYLLTISNVTVPGVNFNIKNTLKKKNIFL